jgi:hypothetical protein
MTSQKKIAMALALCAALVEADNCGTWSKGKGKNALTYATMEFKAADVRKNLKCTTTDVNAASCTNCCKTRDICHNMAVACGADKVKDGAKMSVATTSTTKVDDCCSAEAKCDAHTCGTGWEADATKATVKCGATTCTNTLCCKLKVETCEGHMTAGNKCHMDEDRTIFTHVYDSTKAATALTLAQAGTFQATCCKKKETCAGLFTACGAGKLHDNSKTDAATTAVDYEATCCKTALKCGTDFSCAGQPGWLADATKDNLQCAETGEDLARKQVCNAATCCKPDPAKCRGYAGACPTDKQRSEGTANTAVATADEFKTSCCVAAPKPTCDEAMAFKVSEGTASRSSHQHDPVMVLLFAAMGALALRM